MTHGPGRKEGRSRLGAGKRQPPRQTSLGGAFRTRSAMNPGSRRGRPTPVVTLFRHPLPTIARAGSPSSDVTTLTGTGLAVTPEHVSLGTFADEGSVRVDAGVLSQRGGSASSNPLLQIPQPGIRSRTSCPLTLLLLPGKARSPGDSPTISPERAEDRGSPPSPTAVTFSTQVAKLFPVREAPKGTHASRS